MSHNCWLSSGDHLHNGWRSVLCLTSQGGVPDVGAGATQDPGERCWGPEAHVLFELHDAKSLVKDEFGVLHSD